MWQQQISLHEYIRKRHQQQHIFSFVISISQQNSHVSSSSSSSKWKLFPSLVNRSCCISASRDMTSRYNIRNLFSKTKLLSVFYWKNCWGMDAAMFPWQYSTKFCHYCGTASIRLWDVIHWLVQLCQMTMRSVRNWSFCLNSLSVGSGEQVWHDIFSPQILQSKV